MPPLVFAGEARSLLDDLAEVVEGQAFLLQAGDCAESFYDWTAPNLREKLKIILQMSAVLTYAASLPVVKVGRIAGQFVKPRSEPTETVGDLVLPSSAATSCTATSRPRRRAGPTPRGCSRATTRPRRRSTCCARSRRAGSPTSARYRRGRRSSWPTRPRAAATSSWPPRSSGRSSFMSAIGVDMRNPALHQTDIWTSHEALLLDFEEALTRRDSLTGDWYDCSAHFLWVGERTRQPDGAHVEFLAGVHNPLGVKLGPAATPEETLVLCETLNPGRMPGRLTLIARMGAERVGETLPPLVRAVRDAGHPVVWVCDPMHANTFRTAGGRKTREFGHILAEIEGFFAVHHAEGTWPGGVHLEITGDDVTECLGGGDSLSEEQLDDAYTTLCDPRLNARQSLDLVFHVAELMRAA